MDHNDQLNILASATLGFDKLFENDIRGANNLFLKHDDPFHLLGLGVCAFLQAALGMEAHLMEEANRCLNLAETGTRKSTNTKTHAENHRFHPGIEWEILNADAVVLLGLVHALSESYMGYLQCLYSLNSAHSKFTKLFKTVFPNGIDSHLPNPGPIAKFNGSVSYSSESSAASSVSTLSAPPQSEPEPTPPPKRGFFSRWTPTTNASTPALTAAHHRAHIHPSRPDGPIDNLIISGTAFGYGLFNLIFSLLPKRVQNVVGFFGFKHDRKLALQALSVSAALHDPHSIFAGLVLMTYHGVVLLLSGYQANETKIVKEYQVLVDRLLQRHPNGALWILNKAKILRMSHDAEGAIKVLQDGLRPDRQIAFPQADSLLIFELAWTLLGQRRYEEAANTFLRMTELNTWSHPTYYFIAAGCHWSLGNREKAQYLFDAIPGMIDKKIGGKELPTEVFLKKKIAFYKAKQVRLGKSEERFVDAITISPADEMAIFWNTHARIPESIALLHIQELTSTLPSHTITSPISTPSLSPSPSPSISTSTSTTSSLSTSTTNKVPPLPLDTPDEFALRSLLLGIIHRTIKQYGVSRRYLEDAVGYQERVGISGWIGGVAMFEIAVLDLKEAEAEERLSLNDEDENGSGSGSSGSSTISGGEVLVNGNANGNGIADVNANVNVNGKDKENGNGRKKEQKERWNKATKSALKHLEKALGLATNSTDLSSRLDTRISMLKDEIMAKKELVGIQ